MHPFADDAKGPKGSCPKADRRLSIGYSLTISAPGSCLVTDTQSATAQLTAQVTHLTTEGLSLYALLKDTDTGYWTSQTDFKGWTTWDIIAHLHFSDHMALTSLTNEQDFKALLRAISSSSGLTSYTQQWLSPQSSTPLSGPELLSRWFNTFEQLCAALGQADPEQRFQWVGPSMKARMFATARQMETWAHAWAIYDLMQQPRTHSDSLEPIVNIGVRTYAWSFRNRGLEVPSPAPYIRLLAPSGATWTFNESKDLNSNTESITGSAVEFCQVVTQVRNIADTTLVVNGSNATAWMAIAQCFAGPPEDPPAPGSRVPRAIRIV